MFFIWFQELVNFVRGILNKLTPSNFEKFLHNIQNLPIDTEERLSLVAKIFYDKVLLLFFNWKLNNSPFFINKGREGAVIFIHIRKDVPILV